MARRLGDQDVLLWTLNARHLVLWGAAPPQEMLETASELAELSRRSSKHSEVLLDALLWCAYDYVELSDMPAMLRVREEYMATVERCASPWHQYMALGIDTLNAAVYGDLTRARELSSSTLEKGRRVQDKLADTFHAVRTMFYDLQQGREGSRAENAFALIDVPAFVAPDYRAFWALNWASRGYAEAARNVLVQTLAHQELLLDSLRRPVLAILAEVSVLLDERAAMAELYELLLPAAGRHMVLQACVYLGSVDHYLGRLANALGQPERACEHLESALRSTFSPVCMAETEYEYGRALSRKGAAKERARALLSSARDHGQRFGFPRLMEQAGAELTALG
jgi:hypothetical protein